MKTLHRCCAGLLAVTLVPALTAQNRPPDPSELDFKDGTGAIPDRATYEKMSYQGPDVMIDTGLRGVQYVKYQFEALDTDKPKLYFINTKTHRSHPAFMRTIGIVRGGRGRGGRGRSGPIKQMRGVLAYRPFLNSPNDTAGLYTIEYEPNDQYQFKMVKMSIEKLGEKAPFTKGKIAYYPIGQRAEAQYQKDKKLYEDAGIPAFFPKDVYKDIAFLPLNAATGFGRLRVMKDGERPSPRDVVLYATLPNEMPRVAGVITEVRQTPLSHVNLRAVQDGVPNAFIANVRKNKSIAALIGKYVRFTVKPSGYEIREAKVAEVEKHFANMRPKKAQVPARDLAAKTIRALSEVEFKDSPSVGVKAANVAMLGRLGFPDGTTPKGFAVPFSFYDAFMKHNGLYAKASAMSKAPGFGGDTDKREKALARFRNEVTKSKVPAWMHKALGEMHKGFPQGTNVRCRSSTNNEDLPGFSGAGLYDSFTNRKGHISESVKLVYASLWNFRAYEEREFYRIDHFATAMGVLCHPNYSKEEANGVAVSDDIVYQSGRNYYVNVQVGEDMVTNPDALSIPEELLLSPSSARDDKLIQVSSRAKDGARILGREHREQLRRHLGRIKRKFRRLYGHKRSDGKFAMEIEFKITAEGKLAIKQARPWVY